MTTLSKDILRQIQTLQIKAGRLVQGSIVGQYASRFRGQGMEFEEVREYAYGDEVRQIDWNVTARMSTPYVKVFREERELTLMVMVDVSRSQSFGSNHRSKEAASAECAAILAYMAIRNQDRVGALIFSDHVEQMVVPKKGKSHVWSIIRSVLTHEASGRGTDLAQAIESFQKIQKKRAQLFIISDFLFPLSSLEKSFATLVKKHEVVALVCRDSLDAILPDVGYVQFEDSESGERVTLNTSHPDVRKEYSDAMESLKKERSHFFRKHRIEFVDLDTEKSSLDPLIQIFHKKKKKR